MACCKNQNIPFILFCITKSTPLPWNNKILTYCCFVRKPKVVSPSLSPKACHFLLLISKLTNISIIFRAVTKTTYCIRLDISAYKVAPISEWYSFVVINSFWMTPCLKKNQCWHVIMDKLFLSIKSGKPSSAQTLILISSAKLLWTWEETIWLHQNLFSISQFIKM